MDSVTLPSAALGHASPARASDSSLRPLASSAADQLELATAEHIPRWATSIFHDRPCTCRGARDKHVQRGRRQGFVKAPCGIHS